MEVLVTGGTGCIGSALVRYLVQKKICFVVKVNKVTYASNSQSLEPVGGSPIQI